MFPTFTPAPTMEPVNHNEEPQYGRLKESDDQVVFCKFSECDHKNYIKVRWKFPYHMLTKTGKDYGFFVQTPAKPRPPSNLKNRRWGFEKTFYRGKEGWYVYVEQFTNNFDPESVKYVYGDE